MKVNLPTERLQERCIHTVGIRTVEVFQIWFDEPSAAHLDTLATPVFNKHCGAYFENDVIRRVVPDASTSFVAVIGWRFLSKTGRCVQNLLDSVSGNADGIVFSATSAAGMTDIWAQGEAHHPGIRGLAEALLKKMGVRFQLGSLTPGIYCNFFAAATDVYQDYVEEMLLPAIDLMDNDPQISAIAQRSCEYPNGLPADALIKRTGLPAYTYRPFICERLFPTFCALNGLQVSGW